MDENQADPSIHPAGELSSADQELTAERPSAAVDTLGSKVFVRWDPEAAVTAFGLIAYFIEFLKPTSCGSSGWRIARWPTAVRMRRRSRTSWAHSC
jgi:hypothetical protein